MLVRVSFVQRDWRVCQEERGRIAEEGVRGLEEREGSNVSIHSNLDLVDGLMDLCFFHGFQVVRVVQVCRKVKRWRKEIDRPFAAFATSNARDTADRRSGSFQI
jgi:hypothetical protein